jgi:GAF domain-containing protein
VTLALDDPVRLDLLHRAGLLGKGISARLTQIASAAVALTSADQCELNIIVGDEQRHIAWWPDVGAHDDPGPSDESACLLVVLSEQPLVLDDVFTNPHCAKTPWAGTRINSYMGVPVRYEGAVVGSLCVFSLDHKHWTAGELAAMQGMASLIEACFPLPTP